MADTDGRAVKPCVWGRSIDGIAGSNLAGGMGVCCECYVLTGRVVCVGPITRPKNPHRVWYF